MGLLQSLMDDKIRLDLIAPVLGSGQVLLVGTVRSTKTANAHFDPSGLYSRLILAERPGKRCNGLLVSLIRRPKHTPLRCEPKDGRILHDLRSSRQTILRTRL